MCCRSLGALVALLALADLEVLVLGVVDDLDLHGLRNHDGGALARHLLRVGLLEQLVLVLDLLQLEVQVADLSIERLARLLVVGALLVEAGLVAQRLAGLVRLLLLEGEARVEASDVGVQLGDLLVLHVELRLLRLDKGLDGRLGIAASVLRVHDVVLHGLHLPLHLVHGLRHLGDVNDLDRRRRLALKALVKDLEEVVLHFLLEVSHGLVHDKLHVAQAHGVDGRLARVGWADDRLLALNRRARARAHGRQRAAEVRGRRKAREARRARRAHGLLRHAEGGHGLRNLVRLHLRRRDSLVVLHDIYGVVICERKRKQL